MKGIFPIIFFILLGLSNNIFAQDANDILLKEYHAEKHDTSKIVSLHKYIKLNYSSPDSAIKYSKISIELSDKIQNIALLAKSYNLLAISYYYSGDLINSEKNLNRSLSYYTQLKDKRGMATCYNGIGVIHYDQGKLYRALQLYIQSLRIKEQLGGQLSIAMTLNNIGNVYKDLEKVEKSLEYYNKSLAIKKTLSDKHGIAMTLNNIGLLYHNNGEYVKAQDYYKRSLIIKKEISDLHGEAMTLNNIGLTYEVQKKFNLAIPYYEKSIAIKKEIGDQYGLAMSLINLATVYRANKNYSRCYKKLFESEKIAKKIGATTQLRDCYQRLYETYEIQSNIKQAYKYYRLYIAAKDSMMSAESIKNIQKLQAQYENEAKQLTIKNLTKKEELSQAKLDKNKAELKSKNIINIGLIGVLILSAILGVFFFFSFKQRTKTNLTLKKSLDEKEVLFKEVHHRVKNNFQVISSLLNLHANNTDNEAVKKALGEAKDRVGSMALVHEKLYQSKDLTQIKMDEYISQLIMHLSDGFDIETEFATILKIEDIYLSIETAVPLGLIFNELITNSLKYAFKKGANNSIEIEIKKIEDKIQVEYKDNGIGLPKNFDLDKLESLGLNLVQILVLQIQGELVVDTGKGACFRFEFSLPK
ncbi:MAG: hypothetical protein COA97_00150 [Flavobacteriales bacterium]|nr:MAG: hypothetical protein COA97_00150 [Flavobacteriales bacterium]